MEQYTMIGTVVVPHLFLSTPRLYLEVS